MDFEEIKRWYMEALNKYVEFEGRSRRKEYWTFVLVNSAISIILSALDSTIGFGFGFLGLLFYLAILLPSIAVSVRRLHDIGKSGLWLLLAFVPIVNLVLIYFFLLDSETGSNEYGANPKAV